MIHKTRTREDEPHEVAPVVVGLLPVQDAEEPTNAEGDEAPEEEHEEVPVHRFVCVCRYQMGFGWGGVEARAGWRVRGVCRYTSDGTLGLRHVVRAIGESIVRAPGELEGTAPEVEAEKCRPRGLDPAHLPEALVPVHLGRGMGHVCM